MMEARMNEIMAEMNACSREKYRKDEMLDELMKLQHQMVEITFAGEDVDLTQMKIWHVVERLEKLNAEKNHIADEKIEIFKRKSISFSNEIKGLFCGFRGEFRVAKTLKYLRVGNRIVRGVELHDDQYRTELDEVVITPSGIFILEVKNPSRAIFIDENGNYFYNGEFKRWNCNIALKMEFREKLLKAILENAGYGEIPVRSLLIFTDSRIEVVNRCRDLHVSFLSQLNYIIESYRGEPVLSEADMDILESAVKEADQKAEYCMDFKTQEFKELFAEITAKLEEPVKEKKSLADVFRAILAHGKGKYDLLRVSREG